MPTEIWCLSFNLKKLALALVLAGVGGKRTESDYRLLTFSITEVVVM